jgi:hypothetical protein
MNDKECRLVASQVATFHRPQTGSNITTVEHAPQKKGRGDLGGNARVAGLTCSDCNQSAGTTFESIANREHLVFSAAKIPACAGHSRRPRISAGGLVLPTYHSEAATAADIKSAYMLAFVTLGHRWAFCASLDPIRKAIRTGNGNSHSAVRVHLADTRTEQVLEINDPMSFVAVVGQSGQAILLPQCGSSADLLNTFQFVSSIGNRTMSVSKTHVWPIPNWMQKPVSRGTKPAFHWDLCSSIEHERCSLHLALLPDDYAIFGSKEFVDDEHRASWQAHTDGQVATTDNSDI